MVKLYSQRDNSSVIIIIKFHTPMEGKFVSLEP